MIEIFAARNGSRCRLYVKGHADYQPGNDVVCAGVSALTGTLLGFAADESLAKHLRVSLSRGEAFLSCRGGLGAAFDAALYGFSRIAEQYPDHVRVVVTG